MEKKLKNGEQYNFVFNQKAVKYLADIVNNSSLTEVEYTCGEISIRFSKQINSITMPTYQQPATLHTAPLNNSHEQAAKMAPSSVATQATSNDKVITAPVVGKVLFTIF